MRLRWHPHVTVAAIIEHDGRYLLVEEHTPDGLRLNNPAGHLEQGESPLAACVREVLEETAHRFTPTALLGVYMSRARRPEQGEDVTYLRLAFTGALGEVVPGRRLDEGIVRTLWLTLEEVQTSRARHRSPLVARCIEDHARGQRLPLHALFVDDAVVGM